MNWLALWNCQNISIFSIEFMIITVQHSWFASSSSLRGNDHIIRSDSARRATCRGMSLSFRFGLRMGSGRESTGIPKVIQYAGMLITGFDDSLRLMDRVC